MCASEQIAVAAPNGLMVPVLRNVESMSFAGTLCVLAVCLSSRAVDRDRASNRVVWREGQKRQAHDGGDGRRVRASLVRVVYLR
jgi:hypothetical protein